ncbi:hypothetical protein GQ457_06G020240 [Hibiscus cannabinus]
MIPTVLSGLVLMKKRRVMEVFPPSLRKLWKELELRAMAIISLLIQILLIVLGKRRRHIPGDIYDDGGKLEKDNELTALWAPFFLLHLGGPDTITAYSLEDNELYLRHLFGLLVQTVITVYILFMAWTGSRLSYLDIPMIVVGCIKYGERTWALWKASGDELQDSMLSLPDHGPNYAKLMDEYSLRHAEGFFVEIVEVKDVEEEQNRTAISDAGSQGSLIKAYTMFRTFRRLFADLILSYQEQEKSQSLFKNMSHEEAFDVIAIELGFIYDLLYTKATVIYNGWGMVRRLVTFSLTCIVLVIFSFDDLEKYKMVDVVITFMLVVGAILLEIYAAFTLLFSDHTKRWLITHKQTKISQLIDRMELVKLPRWSGRMAQYNLLSLCLNEKPGLRLLEKHRYKSEVRFGKGLEKLIFKHVKSKFDQLEGKKGTHKNLRDVCSQRGNGIIEKYKQHIELNLQWSVICEFDQSILIWHIATELCYYKEGNIDETLETNLTMSLRISRYMLYLLAVYPTMLPVGIGLIRLRDTRAEAEKLFEERLSTSKNKKESSETAESLRNDACEMLRHVRTHVHPIKVKGDRSKSVLFDGCRLASALEKISDEVRWEFIRDMWLEMLTFAATQCRGRQHAHQLRRGGELLTHVWLLMAHFGTLLCLSLQFKLQTMEVIVVGAAASICHEAGKVILHSVKRRIRHRTRVEHDVDVAEKNGEKIKANVLDWRSRVDKAIAEEEKKAKDLQAKAKDKCFIGSCPNIKCGTGLARQQEKIPPFDELIKE